MDARTRDTLINGALRIALDVTGLIPGLSEAKGGLQLAVDAAPVVEAAIEYFQTKQGQRAISHVRAVFDALQTTDGLPVNWTTQDAIKALEEGRA